LTLAKVFNYKGVTG